MTEQTEAPLSALVRDWPDAPEGTTHALLRVGAHTVWLKLGQGVAPAYWWRDRSAVWVRELNPSGHWLQQPGVVPKVATDYA